MNVRLTLTYTQARRAATSIASRIYDMDQQRPKNWEKQETDCSLTKSDQRYRAELQETYDAIMKQIVEGA